MSKEKLGSLIRNTRKARGFTQVTVAEMAGISQSMISKIENGLLEPDFTTAVKMADCLLIPLSQLADEAKAP